MITKAMIYAGVKAAAFGATLIAGVLTTVKEIREIRLLNESCFVPVEVEPVEE